MFIFGTRPEAIKLAPIIKLFESKRDDFETMILVTGQHREMLSQVLKIFNIVPDYDLKVMTDNQSLPTLTARIIDEVSKILKKENPDYVMVQGDTTTVFSSALAAFYNHIPVLHIEAGLRTHNKYSPFPEEINRVLTSKIAHMHFAPTDEACHNLIREGVDADSIYVVGNSVVDALISVSEQLKNPEILNNVKNHFKNNYNLVFQNNIRYVLVTGHRRESFGDGFNEICLAIKKLSESLDNVVFIYPVHLNPNVKKPVENILKGSNNVFLLPPLDYVPFVYLLNKCSIVLTDSGGIQEEAPSLGKPIVVMRENTERPEGVDVGTAVLSGANYENIVNIVTELVINKSAYIKMSQAENPYGDGLTSRRVLEIIKNIESSS